MSDTDQAGEPTPEPTPEPTYEPTYEEAREELLEVVRRLEHGGTTLAESLAAWERAEHLAGVCQRFLDGARERLEAVMTDSERP